MNIISISNINLFNLIIWVNKLKYNDEELFLFPNNGHYINKYTLKCQHNAYILTFASMQLK